MLEPLPAASNKAGVAAVAEVLVVATFCETVKLPAVLTEMLPVALIPL